MHCFSLVQMLRKEDFFLVNFNSYLFFNHFQNVTEVVYCKPSCISRFLKFLKELSRKYSTVTANSIKSQNSKNFSCNKNNEWKKISTCTFESFSKAVLKLFLAYGIGESLELPVHNFTRCMDEFMARTEFLDLNSITFQRLVPNFS